ncbi:MAG TPA: PfaD family polyunsaturated fatty acid/polyketide biosynthesis protein [Gemmataceae bacterium]|nr:PfaD family polyunsaturated fatty acid/polyketide biosynthesis protein [Gemmataceae bacterium]
MTDTHVIQDAIRAIRWPIHLVENAGHYALISPEESDAPPPGARMAYAPACRLEDLGDPTFCADHRIRYPYLAGAMANGIGSADIVEAMGRAGMLAFFGAAGLPIATVESAIDRIQNNLGDTPYGFNLIHSPGEPNLERAVVDLYVRRGVRLVEASAFLDLTLPVVRYRVHGIHRAPSGKIVTPNRVIVKVSRVEVASKFLAPPPDRMLQELVRQGDITPDQAALAARMPVAQDVTAEADSGGHTDNRPAITLVPTLIALRDRLQSQYGYDQPLRVGTAGGIATPASAAAAFAMGAAYVLTGSVNQACVESGSSDAVREMLAQAEQADTIMAPAADMFEMGVKVQVLKRGTMFAMRAAKLYELYRAYPSLEALPDTERANLEKNLFRAPLAEIWEKTRVFFLQRDPAQVERAGRDPKHKMALVFRWYLGLSSRWANTGEPTRRLDYQIWCGPAMGAFNEWTKGSFLEQPRDRRVVTVAFNILYGAAVLLRLQTLRSQGFPLLREWSRVTPLEMETIKGLI